MTRRTAAAMFCVSLMASSASAAPVTVTLWPEAAHMGNPRVKGPEQTGKGKSLVAGQAWTQISNVSQPTLTIYPAQGDNTGATIMVLPGGGYRVLAMDLEGTEVCDWLTPKGITCVVLKYRVPASGPWWNPDCNCREHPKVWLGLQDAQRALRLLRQEAKTYGIDPKRIGVLGFSAGGHLAAAVSTRPEAAYTPVDAADSQAFRPDFAVVLYPGHLWREPDLTLEPDIKITSGTPPTFLLHAKDDPVDDVRHSLVYEAALRKAGVPVEMHLYARGGHAFGLRPTGLPISEWPQRVETWLRKIGVVKTED
ncbi:alpha/beta hydrolase [Asticcacaulis excentricus]|uniref:Xylanase n=1 Tax=Asticcacaulis excentricus (strain ATCC 15261 / DSM 4724 / KCTC 12464 / NCIMB 9791 / VKM B-1370 / CB 48) TaxID=573065 RepID=E8RPD4_ASTEC|nr:alpha/beta hydrolase [Asticcacaulis excentricus]ADU11980.1 xylanase [Asticcacaulis excentricus CB 48]